MYPINLTDLEDLETPFTQSETFLAMFDNNSDVDFVGDLDTRYLVREPETATEE